MKRKALFLDRDGVINEDRRYVGSWKDFVFVPSIFPFLRRVQEAGFRLVIVTNQSGVARRYYSKEDYEKLTAQMLAAFSKEGVHIDGVFEAFCYAEGTDPLYTRGTYWRKPNAGMILEAAVKLDIDLSRSAMIGDKETDMLAAHEAGIPARFFLSRKEKEPSSLFQTIRNFDEAWQAMQGLLG